MTSMEPVEDRLIERVTEMMIGSEELRTTDKFLMLEDVARAGETIFYRVEFRIFGRRFVGEPRQIPAGPFQQEGFLKEGMVVVRRAIRYYAERLRMPSLPANVHEQTPVDKPRDDEGFSFIVRLLSNAGQEDHQSQRS